MNGVQCLKQKKMKNKIEELISAHKIRRQDIHNIMETLSAINNALDKEEIECITKELELELNLRNSFISELEDLL